MRRRERCSGWPRHSPIRSSVIRKPLRGSVRRITVDVDVIDEPSSGATASPTAGPDRSAPNVGGAGWFCRPTSRAGGTRLAPCLVQKQRWGLLTASGPCGICRGRGRHRTRPTASWKNGRRSPHVTLGSTRKAKVESFAAPAPIETVEPDSHPLLDVPALRFVALSSAPSLAPGLGFHAPAFGFGPCVLAADLMPAALEAALTICSQIGHESGQKSGGIRPMPAHPDTTDAGVSRPSTVGAIMALDARELK